VTHIRRGEVYWVDFDPGIGGEIQKTRPAIVVSNNSANQALNRIQVVPITSRIDRVYPGEALISLNGQERKAIAARLTTASKLRVGAKLGFIASEDMVRVEAAMAIQLGLTLK
jgi:mRNA interferase MazF